MNSNSFLKLLMGMSAVILIIVSISLFAIIGGTIIYWLWPVAIPAAFPGVVTAGYIAAKLSWWQAICLMWLCGLLIKSSSAVSNKK